MRVQGTATLPEDPATVWAGLMNPQVMARCVPGCHQLTLAGTDAYALQLKLGVGPVSGTYRGHLRIVDADPPSTYRVEFDGGGPQGIVRGTARAELRGENGGTLVTYGCDVEVGGLFASVGQRMLQGIGRVLIDQMFRKFQREILRESVG